VRIIMKGRRKIWRWGKEDNVSKNNEKRNSIMKYNNNVEMQCMKINGYMYVYEESNMYVRKYIISWEIWHVSEKINM